MSIHQEEISMLRQILLAFGLYVVLLIVVGLSLMILPIEIRQSIWWIAPVVAGIVFGIFCGYGGSKWSSGFFTVFAIVAVTFIFKRQTPIAGLGALVSFIIGYGVGRLLKNREPIR